MNMALMAKEKAQAVSQARSTPTSRAILQRQPISSVADSGEHCACGGGCPRCQKSALLQTKLKISEPGDKYEQEADRVADQVMRMGDSSVQRQVKPDTATSPQVQGIQAPGNGATPTATGKCYTCEIPGGIGVCCYGENAPIVPECLELGKKVFDNCKDGYQSCLQRAQCAQCKCIGQTAGEQYCQCTGIV
ncbi:MAG: hypothetical protein LH702_00505 [Phormidesmis sp. CAN_BIN44]|nr:hypothetical protein [Phormidesmis sp. CAN_BIN44]